MIDRIVRGALWWLMVSIVLMVIWALISLWRDRQVEKAEEESERYGS